MHLSEEHCLDEELDENCSLWLDFPNDEIVEALSLFYELNTFPALDAWIDENDNGTFLKL